MKARPLPQRVLRTCAALAACLVVAVGVAAGINLVNPVLMESMPGVGQIFQELNHRGEPTPSPPRMRKAASRAKRKACRISRLSSLLPSRWKTTWGC